MRQMLVGDESANVDVIFDKPIRAERLEALAKFLHKWVRYEDAGEGIDEEETRVTVYICEDISLGGLRVEEIAFKYLKGGDSFQRSIAEHAPVILAAEMFLQTWGDKPYKPANWESYINEHGVARLRLLDALSFHKSAGEDLAAQRAEEAALEKETANV